MWEIGGGLIVILNHNVFRDENRFSLKSLILPEFHQKRMFSVTRICLRDPIPTGYYEGLFYLLFEPNLT